MATEETTPDSSQRQRVLCAFKVFVKEVKQKLAAREAEEGCFGQRVNFSEMWRKLSEEERQAYFDKHAALKKREESTLGSFESSAAEMSFASGDPSSAHLLQAAHGDSDPCPDSSQHPKRRKKRGPNPFVLFVSEKRRTTPAIWKGRGGLGLLADIWRRMDDELKEPYYRQSRTLKQQQRTAGSRVSSPKKDKLCKTSSKCGSENRSSRSTVDAPTKRILRSSSPAQLQQVLLAVKSEEAADENAKRVITSAEKRKALASKMPTTPLVPPDRQRTPGPLAISACYGPAVDPLSRSVTPYESRPSHSSQWHSQNVVPFSSYHHQMMLAAGMNSHNFSGYTPSSPYYTTFCMYRQTFCPSPTPYAHPPTPSFYGSGQPPCHIHGPSLCMPSPGFQGNCFGFFGRNDNKPAAAAGNTSAEYQPRPSSAFCGCNEHKPDASAGNTSAEFQPRPTFAFYGCNDHNPDASAGNTSTEFEPRSSSAFYGCNDHKHDAWNIGAGFQTRSSSAFCGYNDHKPVVPARNTRPGATSAEDPWAGSLVAQYQQDDGDRSTSSNDLVIVDDGSE